MDDDQALDKIVKGCKAGINETVSALQSRLGIQDDRQWQRVWRKCKRLYGASSKIDDFGANIIISCPVISGGAVATGLSIRGMAASVSERSDQILEDTVSDGRAAKKDEIVDAIDQKLDLRLADKAPTQKQIAMVFDELRNLIADHLAHDGPGIFEMTGLFKIEVISVEGDPPKFKFTARKRLKDAVNPPRESD